MRREAIGNRNPATAPAADFRLGGRRLKLAWALHELPRLMSRRMKLSLLDVDKVALRHQAQGFSEVTGVGKLGRA